MTAVPTNSKTHEEARVTDWIEGNVDTHALDGVTSQAPVRWSDTGDRVLIISGDAFQRTATEPLNAATGGVASASPGAPP